MHCGQCTERLHHWTEPSNYLLLSNIYLSPMASAWQQTPSKQVCGCRMKYALIQHLGGHQILRSLKHTEILPHKFLRLPRMQGKSSNRTPLVCPPRSRNLTTGAKARELDKARGMKLFLSRKLTSSPIHHLRLKRSVYNEKSASFETWSPHNSGQSIWHGRPSRQWEGMMNATERNAAGDTNGWACVRTYV